MSKPYCIRLNETISVQDESTYQISPIPILSNEDFASIIASVLKEAGWEEDDEGILRSELSEGESFYFDPKELAIRSHVDKEMSINQDVEAWNPVELQENVSEIRERETQKLQEAASAQLQESQEARQEILENIITEATGRALKQVAQELGHVESIEEERGEDGSYRLSISIQEIE